MFSAAPQGNSADASVQKPVLVGLPPQHWVARTPALSPDGTKLAYCHQGDIWVAQVADGLAHRLTAHPAFDGRPLWSPDGTRLAFLSRRHGNWDVFIIPSQGGQVQRLTWHQDSESLHGWLNDSTVIMGTTRDRWYSRYGRDQGVWSVSVDGGDPVLVGDFPAQRVSAAPNGKFLVYEQGSGDVRRRAYRGSAASNLWVFDFQSMEHRRLTRRDGNDMHPMVDENSKTVYFLSDRPWKNNPDGREMALWKIAVHGGKAEPVAGKKGLSLRNPHLSAGTSLAVAEVGKELVQISLDSGVMNPLPVYGALDGGPPRFKTITLTDGARELAVSPDGESVAFSAEGDIFVMRNHEDIRRAVRVTSHAAADTNPVWAEQGKSILFISERDGNGEIYRAKPAQEDAEFFRAREFNFERLTQTEKDESSLSLSPDGKTAAWVVGNGQLVVGNPNTFEVTKEMLNSFDTPDYSWSPDSGWLAWSVANDDFNYDIWLAQVSPSGEGQSAKQATPFNLTMHPDDDTHPRWSPDGRKILFTSRRRMLDETDVWVALLRREDHERTKRERLEAAESATLAKKESAKEKSKKDDGKEKQDQGDEEEEDGEQTDEKVDPVQIDFEGISKRLLRLTKREGNEQALGWGEDSEKFFFNASTGTRLTNSSDAEEGFFQSDLWSKEEESLSSERASSFTNHKKEIWYVRDNKIRSRAKKEEPHPFSVTFRMDRQAQREAILGQGWRALNRFFYDPQFHGHNWRASLEKWQPVISAASTSEDFNEMMNWMLGEMNASHMGYYGGKNSSAQETDRSSTGDLGVIWDHAWQGQGKRIAEVLSGGPAARLDSPLVMGDVVLKVDGVVLSANLGLDQLLSATSGEEVGLEVADPSGETRQVLIRPMPASGLRQTMYERRERLLRARVEEASNGKLGYLHIQGMNIDSLLEFERKLFAAGHGKEGLIIDVRENGGGWTTDMLLDMLMVSNHATTIPRGGGKGYPQGRRIFGTWKNPIVVLCNQNSYSNAEIFSWAIKTLGRGPLVGNQTHGAVISTGAVTLLDGSYVRMPFRGWYVNDAAFTNMELNGCPPDYLVEAQPGDFAKGLDRQLEKAVQVGLTLVP